MYHVAHSVNIGGVCFTTTVIMYINSSSFHNYYTDCLCTVNLHMHM